MKLIDDTFDFEGYTIAPERNRVIAASTLADQTVDAFYGEISTSGAFMPWQRATDKIRFRPGEVTCWAGVNGNGKSLVTSQVALGLQRQDERVLLASFEMRPVATMYRMTRQAAGSESPNPALIRAFHTWTDGRLWLYDHYGFCAPEKLLAVLRYAAAELGIRHLLIDSMMKVVEAEDDYNGQKRFVGDLCALAQTYDVHVHLVHHARKGASEAELIDKFSIKGSGSITDQVDNVILVQRNKRKEKAVAAGEVVINVPDTFLTISKQRNGDYEGTIGLWFLPKAQSYVDSEGAHPQYVPLSIVGRDAETPQGVEQHGNGTG